MGEERGEGRRGERGGEGRGEERGEGRGGERRGEEGRNRCTYMYVATCSHTRYGAASLTDVV